ncbi:hypothetical protein [Motilibacter peucedani]|uniref:hypothetical protein n=1 Tax=Motilibacter peucedani TaxID=598650 RepID=UPI000EB5C6DB|nr:hypothetical protein [Motilibacter peucedani]
MEATVFDLADEAVKVRDALAVVAAALQRRATTGTKLTAELTFRNRVRWRGGITAALSDLAGGAESVLELEYLRRVERAHGLPTARRQAPAFVQGTWAMRDCLYDEYAVIAELDGWLGHGDAAGRFRDMRRDNAAATRGQTTLRFGHADVFGEPCQVARLVGEVLTRAGWPGPLRRCGPSCSL